MAKARLLGIIAIMLAFLALAPSITSAAGPTLPSGIQSYVSINLTNSQSTATPAPFQANIIINESTYSNYIAYSGSLANFEYFYSNGTIIPAWIESNSSGKLITWANTIGIGASSKLTIYLGFASKTTNLLSSSGTSGIGEAPQLSSTYAQYDDGASVFTNYWNFAGTTLPSGWTWVSGYSANNGLTITSGAARSYTTETFLPNIILEFYANPSTETNGNTWLGFTEGGTAPGQVGWNNYGVSSSGFGLAYDNPPFSSASSTTNPSSSYIYGQHIYSVIAATTGVSISYDYGSILQTTPAPGTTAVSIGMYSSQTFTITWLRTRAYPPSGVMPSTSFGAVQQVPTLSLSISPNPATYGQSITLTATCNTGDSCAIDYPSLGTAIATGTGSATYTYNAFALAAGSYSSYYANDITLGTNSIGQTLTVNKGSPVLSLTNCTSGALPYSCTTTGTITTHNNQLTASLYRNNALIGTSNTVVSDTLSNAIGTYGYTFNTLGNTNYTTNTISVSFYKYVPMTFYNITNGAQATHTIAPPGTTTDFTYYPYRLNVSSFNGIAYTLTQSYNGGSATTLFSSTASIGYNPPANQATGNYLYALTETQASNTMLFNLSLVPANMLDINSALTFNSYNNGCIQYLPCLAENPTWTAKPSSWKIITANQPIGNQHTNTSAGEQFDSPNTSIAHFNRDITLIYNQFTPTFTFTPNAINNPLLQTTLTLTKFEFLANALTPSAPYTRELYSITTYDQRTSAPLSTNTSVSQTDLLNNYTIANTTPIFTGNALKIWMAISTYQNPNITTTPQISSQANGFFLAVNNYCTAIVQNGNYRTFQAYPVDGNGSLYTISVYKGYATGAVGDFMQIWSGIGNASAKQVQQYRIAYNPFALALENGGSYSFRFLNSNCGLIYATNYTIWSNPITINLPQNLSTPTIQIPNATATCLTTAAAGNTVNVVCSGEDYKNLIKSWNLTLANTSSFSGYLTIESNTINGSSFSKTYTGLSKFDVYQVRIVGVQGDPTFQNAWIFSINGNFITQGFGIGADGFIAILFLLAGLGFGKMGTGEGGFAAGHQISLTLWIEAFMVFILWASGILTFIPVAGIVAMIGLLIIIGALSSRYEGGAYYG